ncbi:MAG: serine/threonine protein kinase [Nitrospirae bacterium]|nr:serine/threonine protein kinase [Nitrospirota bacterium]
MAGTPKNNDWKVGDVVMDLYEVRRIYKSGGMGLVYRIYHRGWDVELAMKIPRPEFFRTEVQKKSFEQEAETWMNLGLHPNIVSCYYVRRINGIPGVFAEHVDGGSLRDWIEQRKLTQISSMIDVAIQFATGLLYAHEQGLVHRDVKSANVMMTTEGIAKVTDFGLALARTLTGEKPQQGDGGSAKPIKSFGGMTPAYCSPEQADHAELTQKTDVWSWAVSILEIFVGDVTWLSGTVAMAVLEGYLADGPVDDSIAPMPPSIASLLRSCFEYEPDKRPRDMREIIGTLKDIYLELTGTPYPRQERLAVSATADSLNNRAISLMDLGRLGDVEALWKEALRTDPSHFDSTFNFALYEWKQGTLSEWSVFRRVEEVLRNRAPNWRTLHVLGKLYLFFGHYSRAAETLWRSVKMRSDTTEELKDLAIALSAEGTDSRSHGQASGLTPSTRWKEVERLCLKANNSSDPYLATCYALSLLRQGREKESEAFYNRIRNSPYFANYGLKEAIHRYLPGFEEIATFEGHSGLVSAAQFCPDSSKVISAGTEDKTVRVWDVASGTCIFVLEGHEDWVTAISIARDGKLALTSSNDGTLRAWDLKSGRCTGVFRAAGEPIRSVAVTPDGKYALTGGNDSFLRLWSVQDGKLLNLLQGHTGPVSAVAASANGLFFLSGGTDGTLRLWNRVTGKCTGVLEGHSGAVTSLSISVSAPYALSGSDDKTICLWDVNSVKLLKRFAGHTGKVVSVAFTSDSAHVLSGSEDNTLCLWDVKSGQRLFVFKNFEASSFSLSSDDKMAALAIWNGVKILEIANRYFLPYTISTPVSSVEAEVREWEFKKEIAEAANCFETAAFGKIPSIIQRARAVKGYERNGEALRLMEQAALHLPKGKLPDSWQLNVIESSGTPVIKSIFVEKAQSVLCAGADGRLRLCSAVTGECQPFPEGHQGGINALDCRGNVVVSGGSDGLIRLWDVSARKCTKIIEWPGKIPGNCPGNLPGNTIANRENNSGEAVMALSMSSDARSVLSLGSDGLICLWSLPDGRCLGKFHEEKGAITGIALLPAAEGFLACYSSGTISLIDVATETTTLSFRMPNNVPAAVAVSPTGCYAATGGTYDGTLILWNIGNGKAVGSLKGHTGAITDLVFSADGRSVLSSSADGTVRLWDSGSNQCLRSFSGHAGRVSSVAFSPDGWQALSGGDDGTLRIFYLDWDLTAKDAVQWDEEAMPYLKLFLSIHKPFVRLAIAELTGERTDDEKDREALREALIKELMEELSRSGLGWISAGGVREKLLELAGRRESGFMLAKGVFGSLLALAEGFWEKGEAKPAIETVNMARSIRGYGRDRAALAFLERLSMHLPHKGLAAVWKEGFFETGSGGAFAASGDGSMAATSAGDGSLTLWNLPVRRPVIQFAGHRGGTRCAVFLNAGGRLLSGGEDGVLRLWDIRKKECIATLTGHAAAVMSVFVSGDGSMAASGDTGGYAFLWSLDSFEPLRVFKTRDGSASAVSLTPAADFLLSGGTGRTLYLWDVSTGKAMGVFTGHSDAITTISVSPCGCSAITGSEDRTLRLWELPSGKCTASLEGHTAAITCSTISPDGRLALTGGRDGIVSVWDLSSLKCAATLPIYGHAVDGLAMQETGHRALSLSSNGTIYSWYVLPELDASAGGSGEEGVAPHVENFLHLHTPLLRETLSRRGKPAYGQSDFHTLLRKLRVGGNGWITARRLVDLLNLQAAERRSNFEKNEKAYAFYLDKGKHSIGDGNYAEGIRLVSAARNVPGHERDCDAIKTLEWLSSTFPRHRLADVWNVRALPGVNGRVSSLAISHDGAYAACGSSKGTIHLWDVREAGALQSTGTIKGTGTLEGHVGVVSFLAFTPDGRSLVSAGADGTLRLWEIPGGTCIKTSQCGGTPDGTGTFGISGGEVTRGCLSPDGRYAATTSTGLPPRLWDLGGGTTRELNLPATALAVSPDGLYAFTASRDCVIVYRNFGDWHPLGEFRGHTGTVYTMCVWPNGRYLLTGGKDGTLRLWDIPTGKCLRVFEGQGGTILSADVSPNGRIVLSGSSNAGIAVWDALSGELLRILQWHTRPVGSVVFCPDGWRFISGGDDGAAYLWYLDWSLMVKPPSRWDDGAKPYLETFLCLHTAPQSGKLSLPKKPQWEERDFQALIKTLSVRGYGWLSHEGVREKLNEMAGNWRKLLAGKRHFFEKAFRDDTKK